MSNQNTEKSLAPLPLPKKKKNAVMIGCICIMISIAMFGYSLNVLQGPILTEMNAMHYFSLLTIFASLGLAIMTPIGGKLGDLFGRRNVIVVSGIIAVACGLGMGVVKTIMPFMILRLLLGAAQGAFTAAPYILMREINEPKDVPKGMGILSSAIAIGGFAGSIIAGALIDRGLKELAIMFPAIPLIIGIVLIGINLPNVKRDTKPQIDVPGVIGLTIVLSSFLLALNFAPRVGWTNPIILGGFVLSIVSGFVFVKIENKAAEPIIPMYLFKNKNFNILLVVGVLTYFYAIPLNSYATLAAQQVLGASSTITGTLQLPRTILTILVPAIVGVWVGKKSGNLWKAMAYALGITVVSFVALSFTTPNTSILIYFVAIALTGVAESYRAVSITPAAQTTLEPQDLGVGTSLVTFMNSLSGLLAGAVSGVIFDASSNVNSAVNSIFFITALVAFVGLLIVVFVVRKNLNNGKEAEKTAA